MARPKIRCQLWINRSETSFFPSTGSYIATMYPFSFAQSNDSETAGLQGPVQTGGRLRRRLLANISYHWRRCEKSTGEVMQIHDSWYKLTCSDIASGGAAAERKARTNIARVH